MDAKILGLYLGCEVQIPLTEFRTGKLTGVYTKAIPAENVNRCQVYHDEQINWFDVEDVKLLLRPLSSMTEEEATEYLKLKYNAVEHFNFVEKDLRGYGGFWYSVGNATKPTFVMFTQIKDENRADQFQYLLSKGFDLFGLIEKGEAIDSTKL